MDDKFDEIFEGQPEEENSPEATPDVQTEGEAVETAPAKTTAADDELDEEAKRVPLAALIDTRMRLRERERELEELRRSQEAAKESPKASTPDPYDDPDGYAAHHAAQIQQALTMQKLEFSKLMAVREHGEDAVTAALKWAAQRAQSDPGFEQLAIGQAHPAEWVVEQHKRHAATEHFLTDPDEYVRRRAAELGLISTTPVVGTQPVIGAEKNKAPRSLAASGSANDRTLPQSDQADFDAIFDHRKR